MSNETHAIDMDMPLLIDHEIPPLLSELLDSKADLLRLLNDILKALSQNAELLIIENPSARLVDSINRTAEKESSSLRYISNLGLLNSFGSINDHVVTIEAPPHPLVTNQPEFPYLLNDHKNIKIPSAWSKSFNLFPGVTIYEAPLSTEEQSELAKKEDDEKELNDSP